MRPLFFFLSVCLAFNHVSALPNFDPFADATSIGGSSYTVGAALAGQTNSPGSRWNALGTNFPDVKPIIVADNLTYPELPSSTSNSVAFTPSPGQGRGARLVLNSGGIGVSGTYYYSFLLKITDRSAVPDYATNNAFAAFSDDPSEQGAQLGRLGARVLTKQSGAGYVLGVSKSANTADFAYETTPHNLDEVVFVVASYEWFPGVSTNINMWINPPSSSFGGSAPPTPTISALTGNTQLNNNNVRAFAILCQFPSAPSGVIDELRVGTTWAFVTGGPELSVQPTNQTRDAGTTATFPVRALGGPPLSYQWQKNGVDLPDVGNISGATTATLSISNLLQADAGGYAVVVTNSYSSVVSSVATLTVNDPVITTQPVSQTLPPGTNAVLEVVAIGTASLSYQWYKDSVGLSDGGNISGATATTLTISNFSFADVGVYFVQVMNGLGSSVASSNASLQTADPSIASQPQSRTNDFGTTATFEVIASGTGPFTYQWHKEGVGDLFDGGNISGSQSNVLAITGVSFPDGGNYSVTVTNALGSANSTAAVLTVRDPAILTQPVSVTNAAGAAVTFHVVAIGSGPLTYQWKKNGASIFDGGNLSGTATDTLTNSSISSADEGNYSVDVTGAFNTGTSAAASLTVINPVAITVQPNPRTVVAGSKAVFAVGVTGTAPLAFQWLANGTNIPGATSFAYALTNVQASDEGGYSVVVSNSLHSVTSSVAALIIATNLHLFSSNVVVIRVGNGAQPLTANGNSMFLDQFATNGAYLNTLNIPDEGPSAMITMGPNSVPSPSSVTGSGLSRSADGRFLVIAAYNTNLTYNAALHTATAQAVPRGIGLINSLAEYTLAVASTNSTFSQTFWRAAVADGTNNFWGAARTPGTYYFGLDAPAALIQSVFPNMRAMAVFNGSIYCVSAVGGNNGVLKLDGMPTTAAGANPTVLFPGSTATSDLEVSPNGNLIYVADDRNAPNGGIQRYEFDGSTWSLVYTLNNGLASGARYVTVDFVGPHPIVYAITKEATDENNRLVVIEDTGAASVGTTVAMAGANQNFRGIRFGPSESPVVVVLPTLSLAPGETNIVLQWNGTFVLQSATNVSGPYLDVSGATSPYTNDTASADQLYFRLRN